MHHQRRRKTTFHSAILPSISRLGAVLAFVLVSASALRAQGPADPAPIENILTLQARAWNRGDIDAFMEHYWKNENLTFSSGGQITRGWQATIDRYKRRYDSRDKMGQLAFADIEVRFLGADAAYVLGRWQLLRNQPIGGNFSLIVQRIDGRWLIVHDHTSVSPETSVPTDAATDS